MESKNYVIVGGSSGIGLAIVKELVERGANVVVISRSAETLQSLSGVTHIVADITQEDLSASQLPEIIHGLVYCPGSINLKQFHSLKIKDFQHDFDLNVLGAVRVLQMSRRALRKAGEASVVLFSTVAVGQGMPFHSSIAIAKGAVEGLTRSLAAEWAPKIRVNCIAPSLTNTPMAAPLLSSSEREKAAAQRHPLRRIGQPEDIAGLAVFLLSSQGKWMSGQVVGMDGGLSQLRV